MDTVLLYERCVGQYVKMLLVVPDIAFEKGVKCILIWKVRMLLLNMNTKSSGINEILRV